MRAGGLRGERGGYLPSGSPDPERFDGGIGSKSRGLTALVGPCARASHEALSRWPRSAHVGARLGEAASRAGREGW